MPCCFAHLTYKMFSGEIENRTRGSLRHSLMSARVSGLLCYWNLSIWLAPLRGCGACVLRVALARNRGPSVGGLPISITTTISFKFCGRFRFVVRLLNPLAHPIAQPALRSRSLFFHDVLHLLAGLILPFFETLKARPRRLCCQLLWLVRCPGAALSRSCSEDAGLLRQT